MLRIFFIPFWFGFFLSVFFFFFLIVRNEEGEITSLAMGHSSSISFLNWHFTLETAFILLTLYNFEERSESLLKNTCFFSGLLQQFDILGQMVMRAFFFCALSKDFVYTLKALHYYLG